VGEITLVQSTERRLTRTSTEWPCLKGRQPIAWFVSTDDPRGSKTPGSGTLLTQPRNLCTEAKLTIWTAFGNHPPGVKEAICRQFNPPAGTPGRPARRSCR